MSTRYLSRTLFVSVIACGLVSTCAFAQQPPSLSISPNKLNMLVGESHMFRAVGADGRMRHNVRWAISPAHAASLSANDGEAMVYALQISSSIMLTAYVDGDTAEASIEVRPGNALPYGSVKWSVTEMPGCLDKKIIPAVPVANGPDIYVQEDCPQGTFVRAIAADGRELWRRQIGPPNPNLAAELAAKAAGKGPKVETGEHLDPNVRSVCDAVESGMSKDDVSQLAALRNEAVAEKQRSTDTWSIEEEGFRCAISFDAKTATVVKKKKTVVTD